MKLKFTLEAVVDVDGVSGAAEAYNRVAGAVDALSHETRMEFKLDARETREVTRRRRGEDSQQ